MSERWGEERSARKRQPNPNAGVIKQSKAALVNGYCTGQTGVTPNRKGYVARLEDNLLPEIKPSSFEREFDKGKGKELQSKFLAVHSSAALAVNVFAPFKSKPQDLHLLDSNGFEAPEFERACEHGLGTFAPQLDLVVEAGDRVIGIESKCLEYLTGKPAKLQRRYNERIRDERAKSGWFRHMEELQGSPDTYKTLDAAQLIKHAFGLAHEFRGKNITLLYLFWEPHNSDRFPVFDVHRREGKAFGKAVGSVGVAFHAMPYPDLWRRWSDRPDCPIWLRKHVSRLQERYEVEMS